VKGSNWKKGAVSILMFVYPFAAAFINRLAVIYRNIHNDLSQKWVFFPSVFSLLLLPLLYSVLAIYVISSVTGAERPKEDRRGLRILLPFAAFGVYAAAVVVTPRFSSGLEVELLNAIPYMVFSLSVLIYSARKL